VAKRKNPAAVSLGRKGGKARLKTMTQKERTEAARKAAIARWGGGVVVTQLGNRNLEDELQVALEHELGARKFAIEVVGGMDGSVAVCIRVNGLKPRRENVRPEDFILDPTRRPTFAAVMSKVRHMIKGLPPTGR
jgi:hypothetical protein